MLEDIDKSVEEKVSYYNVSVKKKHVIPTFSAKIYVGLGVEYSGASHPPEIAKEIIQDYVNEIGWCVTVTDTELFYKGGREPGLIVGIIQYPRFPQCEDVLCQQTMELAQKLLKGLDQYRLSVVFENNANNVFTDTVVIENEEKVDERE